MVYNIDTKSDTMKSTLLYKLETGRYVTDIDYLENSQLIVCMTRGIKVYDVKGSEIRHHISDVCKPGDGGRLWSVSVDNNSKCVVVSENRDRGISGYLHVYRSDSATWQYNRYDVCQWPRRVSVTSEGDYVVGSGDSKLYKYNSRGRQLWCVDTSCHGRWAVALSVGGNGEVFVCFRQKLVVYDKDGRQISTLTTIGRQLTPGGVCVGKYGEIVVSDVNSKSILLFSKQHEFVRTLIDLDFRPSWICLYNNVKLAVCDRHDNMIWVYEL